MEILNRDEENRRDADDFRWQDISAALEGELEKAGHGSEKTWNKESFDVERDLALRKGPYVEVAGPTKSGYKSVDIRKLPKKLFVSNIFPGAPKFKDGMISHYYGTVDFQADAREMPLRMKSVGALFCSCLGFVGDFDTTKPRQLTIEGAKSKNTELREQTISEALDLLEPGGLLIWEGAFSQDLTYAESLGFILVRLFEKKMMGQFWIAAVFKKPELNKDKSNIL